jgi:hypothetical protein
MPIRIVSVTTSGFRHDVPLSAVDYQRLLWAWPPSWVGWL